MKIQQKIAYSCSWQAHLQRAATTLILQPDYFVLEVLQ